MSYIQKNSSIPQGFSIYQPTLGALLEWFPALGTKHLDDLVNAYIPGPLSLMEKRQTISVDFFEHSQRTGQAFKFYAVAGFAAVESPSTASLQGSESSSFNASPVTSNWDWSPVSAPTAGSSRSSRKGNITSRHQTADFSHMPGMKIMTKDGIDVTNAASRGSKTKEQRDHAHLMRIIKACDSCRKKKIRCDPSHKKRGASHISSPPAAKSTKKAKVLPQTQPAAAPAPVAEATLPVSAPSLDFTSSFALADMDLFTQSMEAAEPWEDFIHHAPAGFDMDYDFFYDPDSYLSASFSAPSTSPSSESVSKPISPTSQAEYAVSGLDKSPAGTDCSVPGEKLQTTPPPQPYSGIPDTPGDFNAYTDFNLFSPQSSFSEDGRMVSLTSSSNPSSSASETATWGEMSSWDSRMHPCHLSRDHPPFDDGDGTDPGTSTVSLQAVPGATFAASAYYAGPPGELMQSSAAFSTVEGTDFSRAPDQQHVSSFAGEYIRVCSINCLIAVIHWKLTQLQATPQQCSTYLGSLAINGSSVPSSAEIHKFRGFAQATTQSVDLQQVIDGHVACFGTRTNQPIIDETFGNNSTEDVAATAYSTPLGTLDWHDRSACRRGTQYIDSFMQSTSGTVPGSQTSTSTSPPLSSIAVAVMGLFSIALLVSIYLNGIVWTFAAALTAALAAASHTVKHTTVTNLEFDGFKAFNDKGTRQRISSLRIRLSHIASSRGAFMAAINRRNMMI